MYRTRTFFYSYSCFISTELIGPPLAAWTSELSLWLPMGIGIASLLLCFPVLAIMPESHANRANSCQDIDGDGERMSCSSTSPYRKSRKTGTGIQWYDWQMPNIFALFKYCNMLLAFPIFLVGVFRGVSIRLLLQYTSATFGWKLSQVCALIPCTIWRLTESDERYYHRGSWHQFNTFLLYSARTRPYTKFLLLFFSTGH